MAVDRTNVVDAVGIDKATGEVVLTILDAMPWDDPQHLQLLQDKLNAYLAFVETKELLTAYPLAAGKRIRIDLISMYEIPATAANFLGKAQAATRELGALLSWRTEPLSSQDSAST